MNTYEKCKYLMAVDMYFPKKKILVLARFKIYAILISVKCTDLPPAYIVCSTIDY